MYFTSTSHLVYSTLLTWSVLSSILYQRMFYAKIEYKPLSWEGSFSRSITISLRKLMVKGLFRLNCIFCLSAGSLDLILLGNFNTQQKKACKNHRVVKNACYLTFVVGIKLALCTQRSFPTFGNDSAWGVFFIPDRDKKKEKIFGCFFFWISPWISELDSST